MKTADCRFNQEYINDGSGNLAPDCTEIQNTPTGTSSNYFIDNYLHSTLVDIDGDGDTDRIKVSYNHSYVNGVFEGMNLIKRLPNATEAIFIKGYGWGYNGSLLRPFTSFHAFDIDNDGDKDIIVSTENSFDIHNNLNSTEFETINTDVQLGQYHDHIISADFNGNGYEDVLTFGEGYLTWHKNQFSSNRIEGTVFLDENENGVYDTQEVPLLQQKVVINDELFSWSAEPGKYRFYVDNFGGYTITCLPENHWKFTTDSIVDISVQGQMTTILHNFGLKSNTEITSAEINLTSGPTRCGFTVPFWMNTYNSGTLSSDGYIRLELDDLVSFEHASPMPSNIDGNILYWNIEDLNPTYSDQIYLELKMPGVFSIGEQINMEALVVLNDNGGTQVYSDTYQYSSTINCGYDPNDKLVEPNVPADENYILPDEEIKYTVRFQNTGTDTAINIRITDKLNPSLDWSTFRMVASSHEYSVTMTEGNLEFRFDDIYLPDNTTDEIASHGFVKFAIYPKKDLEEGHVIENSALIYFDFNPPILTNQIKSTIVHSPFFIDIFPSCQADSSGSISISNIWEIDLNHEWSIPGMSGNEVENIPTGNYHLVILDTSGSEVLLDTTLIVTTASSLDISATSNQISCFGDEDGRIEIEEVQNGTPPYLYNWSNGAELDFIDSLSTGEYHLTITDNTGCSMVNTFDILGPDAPLNINLISLEGNLCIGDQNGSITVEAIGGTAPFSYVWDIPNNSSTANNLGVGEYSLTVIDSMNCTSSEEYAITAESNITTERFSIPETENNENGTAWVIPDNGVSPYSYIWDTDPPQTDSVAVGLTSGNYYVTITDAIGCFKVFFVFVDRVVNSEEIEELSYFELSPNPSHGNVDIKVKLKNPLDFSISIKNALGQQIRAFHSNDQFILDQSFNLNNLSAGTYWVSLLVKEKIKTRKLIVFE